MDYTAAQTNLGKGATIIMTHKKTLQNRIKTAWRRVNLPGLKKHNLVIDIGCGGMPNPRAHVSCDFISSDAERDNKLKIDRFFVWADIEHLPFKSGAFDYSILSHVLEHLYHPRESLQEIQRISKAGYIETPNAFYEFIIPHVYHVSRCTLIDNCLTVSFKKRHDETLDQPEYADVRHDLHKNWWNLNCYDSTALLTRYHWQEKINYQIKGTPDQFIKPIDYNEALEIQETKRHFLWKLAMSMVYAIFKPRAKVDYAALLACPHCQGALTIAKHWETAFCVQCAITYPSFKGHLDFRINKKEAAL